LKIGVGRIHTAHFCLFYPQRGLSFGHASHFFDVAFQTGVGKLQGSQIFVV
jgi:hypothetical protein